MAKQLEIIQTDEAGNVTGTYICTSLMRGEEARVDNIPNKEPKRPWERVLEMFLPAGYPHSVTEDYIEYQIYDSLQAFSSSIAGLLSARAVLEGVGVGDANASATSALLLSILQDSAGRIATILFAHRLGTSLEPECKMYRLLADVFNDMAMVLDCLSPGFPKPLRICLLASSSVLRSLCGVAAGSSKASLSAHFARWGNLGELNAKDSSQETVISLLGMLLGCLVVKVTDTPFATWSTLILLLSVHLAMNYKAVRSVCMRTLNRQRANIVLTSLIKHDLVLTPKQVSVRERIFEHDGILRDADDTCMGYCRIGIPVTYLFKRLGKMYELTDSIHLPSERLEQLLNTYEDEGYVLFQDSSEAMSYIILKQGSDTLVQLKAWYHALLVAQRNILNQKSSEKSVTNDLETSLVAVRRNWESAKARLEEAGWDLETAALETSSGRSRMAYNVKS